MNRLRVLFAPDYRAGLSYQAHLAEALARREIDISFLTETRRGLPLFRGSRTRAADIIHVHWPEKYFPHRGDRFDRLRVMRYPLDCWLTARDHPLVLTAHNLLPHNRGGEPGVFRNVRYTARKSKAIFVHSEAAREQFSAAFGVSEDRMHIVPYGDHAVTMGPPMPRAEARGILQLPAEARLCLVFGTVSPYKGTDELLQYWAEAKVPHRLVVVGPVLHEEFADRLRALADGNSAIDLRISRDWLNDQELRIWLSAVDCTIFNYREIFTSGAAALARSYGVPLLSPRRLTAADLYEPHPHVFRFESFSSDFREQLERALATPCDYELAREWRDGTSWDRVAEISAAVYRSVVAQHGSMTLNSENAADNANIKPGKSR